MYTEVAKLNLFEKVYDDGTIVTKKILVVEKENNFFYYQKLMMNGTKIDSYYTKLDKFFSENPIYVYQFILRFV